MILEAVFKLFMLFMVFVAYFIGQYFLWFVFNPNNLKSVNKD